MRNRFLSVLALLALCAVPLGLAACGGKSEKGSDGGPVTLTVGAIPITLVAPLFLGQEKGFFADEDLKLNVKFAEGGAAIVPAVVSGDYQIGYGNITSLILARSKGLPVSIIANSDFASDDPRHDPGVLLVKKSSPIKTAADLNGKRIAINTLKNISDLSVRAAADDLGADSSTFKFVELGFPDMLSALDAGRVDAAAITEPFHTEAREKGDYRMIFYPLAQTKPKLLIDTYFVADGYYKDHRDIVERFRQAVRKSNDFAQAHPDEVRKIVTTYTEMPPELAKKIILPDWSGGPIDTDSLTFMEDLMVKYGLMEADEKPPVAELTNP
jgi:NitT/TauT family transport system substrate-binding protein